VPGRRDCALDTWNWLGWRRSHVSRREAPHRRHPRGTPASTDPPTPNPTDDDLTQASANHHEAYPQKIPNDLLTEMTSSLNGIGTKPADHSTVVFQRPVFQQLALRAQWVGAADVLARAIRLTVMGYFFPSADIVPRHWVGTSFMGYRMDVVDSAETRPGEIRASLGGARGGLDCVGPDAVKTYVEVERGPLVRWNQKDVVASGKLTAELWINVVDVLASIPEAERPWGPE
jgi:hypothetical protein